MLRKPIKVCTIQQCASYKRPQFRKLGTVKGQFVNDTPYRRQSKRTIKNLATIQAIKTALHYFSETNETLHLFLHEYLSHNPMPELNSRDDPDDWFVRLASQPFTQISDPRRASVPSPSARAAALGGDHDVSPRDVVERLLEIRKSILQECTQDSTSLKSADDRTPIMRKAVTGLVSLSAALDDKNDSSGT